MDILIRIIYLRFFDLIGSKNNPVNYVKIFQICAAGKVVDFVEAILSISFEQEYLEGLEGFKLILFVWKKWPLKIKKYIYSNYRMECLFDQQLWTPDGKIRKKGKKTIYTSYHQLSVIQKSLKFKKKWRKCRRIAVSEKA